MKINEIAAPYPLEPSRQVSLFRNGRNQAVRIPREFEIDGTQAIMRKEGNRLIIEPIPNRNQALLDLLATLQPLDEDFPEIEELPLKDEDIF